ncbi:DNA replication/repair protein RecF [Synechococcus sp. BA-124 BA4]|uniref:DNA replication/repair protein RecF n=1 Tax=unclassified Synechococcus TaxID=2626047 RepID=UPI002AD2F790|nr:MULTISPECIES: DNA replication/repair protein RecF [unclassified Synechococcus]MEA5400344.1 DNA replication/repair protein RecF [Synechococcus sp. BA-124 BA4]
MLDFRNYAQLSLELAEPRLLVIGANGEGKSNLLEAVELLGSLRSHRSGHDRDLIRHGRSRALVRGWCGDSHSPGAGEPASVLDQLELELEVRRQGGRQARRNGRTLERQLDLVGPLRCVGFSALDLELVRGEPALRRQWLDRVVLQLEPVYGELLARYGRLLRQRSQLLRRGLGQGEQQLHSLLDAFDQQMALIGTRLHRRRRRALARLQPLAAAWQERLSGGREQLELRYQAGSQLEGEEAEAPWREALLEQLQRQRPEESRLGACQVGPHRDEVALLLGEEPARRFGSAGQQRTLVLALKLAELELVQQLWGEPPLLLLDDVLAELDPKRQELLLEVVGTGHQCLVSATHLTSFSSAWQGGDSQVVRICQGELVDSGGHP